MSPIIQLILQSLPGLISEVQARHAANNPGVTPPRPAAIMAAFEDAFTSTILKDELIKAAHQGEV